MRFYNLIVASVLTYMLYDCIMLNQRVEVQIILIAMITLNLLVGVKAV